MQIGTTTINGKTYDVESTKALCPGVGIIKQDATAIGWDGQCVTVSDSNGDTYDAPCVEEGDLDVSN